jgi:hypothetical protein
MRQVSLLDVHVDGEVGLEHCRNYGFGCQRAVCFLGLTISTEAGSLEELLAGTESYVVVSHVIETAP